jgi:hypothetical protein
MAKAKDIMVMIEKQIIEGLEAKSMDGEKHMQKRDWVKLGLEYQKIKNGIDDGNKTGSMFNDEGEVI